MSASSAQLTSTSLHCGWPCPQTERQEKMWRDYGIHSCFSSKEHGPSLHSVLLLKELSFILLTFKVVYRKSASLVPVTLPQLEVQVQSFY